VRRCAVRFFHMPLVVLFLMYAPFLCVMASAQDMDSVEGVYRQQYEQYTAQETVLTEQMDSLGRLKNQVDGLIGQVSGSPTTNYAQEAERYRQIQLLLPSAIQYSQDLERRNRQLVEVQRRKSELRSTILARQSSLPVWWTQ
jgi:hypothetical protein